MKLSIIIPVYNTQDYLADCLNSVIYDNLPDYEIIIVNDGSTDGSSAIISEYHSKHPDLIHVINKENGGLGDARNYGMNAASGEFLLFLDSDDKLAANAIIEILEELKSEFDICIFDLQQINIDDDEIGIIRGSEKNGSFSLDEYPELLFQPPAACNKIIRRSLFSDNSISFPARFWFEDLYTIPKLYPFAKKVKYIEKKWYLYLMRSGSITNSKNPQRNIEMIDVVDEILSFYHNTGKYNQFCKQLEYMAFYNQFLTSTTRVNLAKPNSPVQGKLVDDFIKKFPSYRDNPYVISMPPKYKLLEKLIRNKMWLPVHLIMKFNNKIKNKKL